MKAAELRDLPGQELEQKLQEFKRELFNLRFQIATHQQENTAGLNRTRQDIARVKTELRLRQLQAVREKKE